MREVPVRVTFTEVVEREFVFYLGFEDDEVLADLTTSDIHEALDDQAAWDQPEKEDWLTGSINDRRVDGFEIAEKVEA